MSDKVFIDTNILIYAHLTNEAKKHKVALDLLRNTLTSSNIWISIQVLSEFYVAMGKYKCEHEQIAEYISAMTKRMNVLPLALATVEKALLIKSKYQFSYWDSLILSAALECECGIVYSEDLTHNQVIEDSLTVINPFVVTTT